MNDKEKYYHISKSSDLAYLLPLAYFLPCEFTMSFPTLSKIPRCLGEIVKSNKLLKMLKSDQFKTETMDAVSAMIFPHFGFRGWKEHYTGHFPAWKLAYFLPLWAKLIEGITGWGLQAIFNMPSAYHIPFFDAAYINNVMKLIVKQAIEQEGWQPMFDVLKEMPCDEDFEPVLSHVRIDFLRSWYHFRATRVSTISLEQCFEEDEDRILEVEDVRANFEEEVIADDYVERFKARLSEKDIKILELRMLGYTYSEVAKKVGYKNHSGVIKRIKFLVSEFEKYESDKK